jgi:hypothetical protein
MVRFQTRKECGLTTSTHQICRKPELVYPTHRKLRPLLGTNTDGFLSLGHAALRYLQFILREPLSIHSAADHLRSFWNPYYCKTLFYIPLDITGVASPGIWLGLELHYVSLWQKIRSVWHFLLAVFHIESEQHLGKCLCDTWSQLMIFVQTTFYLRKGIIWDSRKTNNQKKQNRHYCVNICLYSFLVVSPHVSTIFLGHLQAHMNTILASELHH